MELTIIRHGETNYNVKKLTNSFPSEKVYLTPRGVNQAEEAAEKLKNKNFDIIIISEFFRTEQTASIINIHHLKPIFIDDRINEINTGTDQVSLDDYWDAEKILKKNSEGVIGLGESFDEFKNRVVDFIEDLRKKKQFNKVLVVTHLAVMRIIKSYLKGLPYEKMEEIDFDNCEFEEFEI